MRLAGKNIILGITGSISAYKMILLLRMLTAEGATVKLVMTKAASEFVSPLVLSTLSGHEVLMDMHNGSNWANHVALGRWAHHMLIAPASCNTIAKMAHGHCDNLLLSIYLSATCPVSIAPAMDEDMWMHAATRQNLELLARRGHHILPVGHGKLGSGLTGHGRLAEPEIMMAHLLEKLSSPTHQLFAQKKVLITAGPTHEPLDPVRFIGNHSSGKMGIALAEAFVEAGAEVTLIHGPVTATLPTPGPQLTLVSVTTAHEMLAAVQAVQAQMHWLIMAAAVADYRPAEASTQKIKKKEDVLQLQLVKNPDILHHLGTVKTASQTLVGFALETENGLVNAQQKLARKNADYILLNEYLPGKTGFGYDTNELTVLSKSGNHTTIPFGTKRAVAMALVQLFAHENN